MDAAARQMGEAGPSGRPAAPGAGEGPAFWRSLHAKLVPCGGGGARAGRRRAGRATSGTGAATASGRKQCRQVACGAINGASAHRPGVSESDARLLALATQLADASAGLTAPHPNAGCVLVDAGGRVVAETHHRAQGAESAEVQAVRAAGGAAAGGTAYLNLETGDCHGDDASLRALLGAGVARVVLGLRNPLRHSRGLAIKELRRAGVRVDVLREAPFLGEPEAEQALFQACLDVNEALLHRVATGRPLGILKYAMTLDGKIATTTGHSAWVTSPAARARVFETRARSDAVIVGGETVRRDNPRLTTRREGGHTPARVVMSRTLALPAGANLWDVSTAPTIVMTQRGARYDFQAHLMSLGVEVVQFDFLTPEAVAAYCAERGFLQCLWECGGTLAAPAIAGGTIHKCLAFVAPKLIGGVRAPSPVGDLGNVEMTQAVELSHTAWQAVPPDMLMTGYLPSSGGPAALDALLDAEMPAGGGGGRQRADDGAAPAAAAAPAARPHGVHKRTLQPLPAEQTVEFYKAWDRHGALSNFSPHAVRLSDGSGRLREWRTLEHFYQAQKFAGVDSAEARQLVEEIAAAASPEEAARQGRAAQRGRPALVRPDWETAKLGVMAAGLQAKFTQNAGPRAALEATAPARLVEASPHDFFWGRGIDHSGCNHLGAALTRLRDELLAAPRPPAVAAGDPVRV